MPNVDSIVAIAIIGIVTIGIGGALIKGHFLGDNGIVTSARQGVSVSPGYVSPYDADRAGGTRRNRKLKKSRKK